MYFKLVKLPIFMLDLDFRPGHMKKHCKSIRNFLPVQEKAISSFFGRKNSATRGTFSHPNNSGLPLPPSISKLDSRNLALLSEQSE